MRGNLQVNQSEKVVAEVRSLHSFGSIHSLGYISFATCYRQNRITRVPETISSLAQLETLSLSSNHLADLPDSLSRMPAIRNIYANGNVLTTIPEELVLSTTLQVTFAQLRPKYFLAFIHTQNAILRCSTWRTIVSSVYQLPCPQITDSATSINLRVWLLKRMTGAAKIL